MSKSTPGHPAHKPPKKPVLKHVPRGTNRGKPKFQRSGKYNTRKFPGAKKGEAVSKTALVKKRLLRGWTITSWRAIHGIGATRLADIIFRLRKKGMRIHTEQKEFTDRFGSASVFALYWWFGEIPVITQSVKQKKRGELHEFYFHHHYPMKYQEMTIHIVNYFKKQGIGVTRSGVDLLNIGDNKPMIIVTGSKRIKYLVYIKYSPK